MIVRATKFYRFGQEMLNEAELPAFDNPCGQIVQFERTVFNPCILANNLLLSAAI
jgi:hypothetical protein